MKAYRSEDYFCEFIATFFLVLTVCLNVVQRTALAPIAIGFVLMVMVYAVGNVSGGHLNPAVTLGVFVDDCLSGKFSYEKVTKVGLYISSQVLGGLCGGLTASHLLNDATFELYPATGYTWIGAGVAELLCTMALVFVVLGVCKHDDNQYGGLAIGLTVMCSAFAIGGISGCSLNPAVTIGVLLPHLLLTGIVGRFGMYIFFPLLGGIMASVISHILRREDSSKLPARQTALEHRRMTAEQEQFSHLKAQHLGSP